MVNDSSNLLIVALSYILGRGLRSTLLLCEDGGAGSAVGAIARVCKHVAPFPNDD